MGVDEHKAAAVTADPGTGEAAFEELAQRVLGEVRSAFSAIVEASPQPVRRAVDLQRALDVDAPLAWRVFKVVSAEDALAAAPYVPTRGQVQTLLEASGRAGLPEGVLARARRAIDGYEEFRREHAGERAALDAMIAALRPGDVGEIDEKTRRVAFEQNARIWGLRAAAAARAFILHPTLPPTAPPTPAAADAPAASPLGATAVAGLIGLHAVRPGVPLVVHARSMFDSGQGRIGDAAEGTYRAEDHSGVLTAFSTPGLEYRTEMGEDNMVTTRVCAPGIGRRAAATTFSLTRSTVESEGLNTITMNHGTSTPTEVCHLDLLVPAGMSDPGTARMAVYGRRTRVEAVFERRPADLLPIRGGVTHLGTLRDVPVLTGVPRWPEVVRHVLEVVGAGELTFDVYRCSVTYPVLHTLVSMQVDTRKA